MGVLRRVRSAGIDGLGYVVGRLKRFDPLANLVIFSEPRGGSTWLAECLARLPHTVVLWEPLNIREMPRFRRLGFAWRQPIPEDADWEPARRAFQDVFEGRMLNAWTCTLALPTDFLMAERMVVKFCRANAMIPWLVRNFAFRQKPIYLIRHPFAVVASQMAHAGWRREFDGFRMPDCPYRELYDRHAAFLSSLSSKEEELLAIWCLANLVPLNHPRRDLDWITVHYEDLLERPRVELGRVFSAWGMALSPAVLDHVGLASSTAGGALPGSAAQLTKWQRAFTPAQVDRMLAVLAYFGVRRYGAGLYPDRGA
jgi:hypothetical protein